MSRRPLVIYFFMFIILLLAKVLTGKSRLHEGHLMIRTQT